MLVSNEDFMPNKPANQNLIEQMKKKISSKDVQTSFENRQRTRTVALDSMNKSSEMINASLPVNFEASTDPRDIRDAPENQLSVRSLTEVKNSEEANSFISNGMLNSKGKREDARIRDLSGFEKDELPNIEEFSCSHTATMSKLSGDENYNADRMYRKKLKTRTTRNVVIKEFSSSGMDAVKSLSSGYTDSSKENNEDDNQDFANYVVGFVCGFFLSIFGVLIMLFCSRRTRRCEGATHGMVVSGIILLVVFNGAIFSFVKNLANENMELEKKKHSFKTPLGSENNLLGNINHEKDFISHDSEQYKRFVFNGKVKSTANMSEEASSIDSIDRVILLV